MRRKSLTFVLAMWLVGSAVHGLGRRPNLTVGRPYEKWVSTTEFTILIPSYNNEEWCVRNLDSVVNQWSTNPFQVVYINDCSTDRTGELVEEYVKQHGFEKDITIIHNLKNMGAMANIHTTIHTRIPDHHVVVILDGDDYLANDFVLRKLEEAYRDPHIWMTYGNFVRSDGVIGYGAEIPRSYQENRTIRSFRWCLAPLRTYKAWLFKKIRKEDVVLSDGSFLDMSNDVAIMYPLIEMCAPKEKGGIIHSKFLSDYLYVYNYTNPLSDFRKDRNKQIKISLDIRRRGAYMPVDPPDTLRR